MSELLLLGEDPRRKDWVEMAQKGVTTEEPIYKASAAVVRPGEEERSLRHVITSTAVDRERDVISADGLEIESYLKNPVVLWAHDRRSPIIAKATDLEQKGQTWESTSIFAPADVYAFADTIFRLAKWMGYSAVSIGFRALEWVYNEARKGIDFQRVELLEYSMVPVPAHQDALEAAKSSGLDPSPYLDWCEQLLSEGDNRLVPTQLLKSIVASAGTRQIFDLAGQGELYAEFSAGEPSDGKDGEMSKGSEPEKPETNKEAPGLRIPVAKCDSCGEAHLDGVAMKAQASGKGYWGTCPTNGDPITAQIGGQKAAQEPDQPKEKGLSPEIFTAWLGTTLKEAEKEAATRVFGVLD